ncbi:MAG: carbamoyltransferase [Tunicatimonas sp.]
MSSFILGISAFYHDSAAALLVDGRLVAAAQEERFTRIKHDASFPQHAIRYVLAEAGVRYAELSAVVFYEKPFIKFERLLESYHAVAPRGLGNFLTAMPGWIKDKLLFKRLLRQHLGRLGEGRPPLLFPEHHLSHAASAFYPSPYEEAAILTVDGVGEWATSTISHGQGHRIQLLRELHFPHSVGLLYSAFTYYLGFRVNGGEYKLMGLAAYGDPAAEQTRRWTGAILRELVELHDDGSITLNMRYFRFLTHLRMTDDQRWERLFGLERRVPEAPLIQSHANLAWAIQHVTERTVLRLANTAHELTGSANLVMAGGVALNGVANGKLVAQGPFENVWIQPAAGDAGGAVGAAYAAWHIGQEQLRKVIRPDAMRGSYLGPSYSDKQIQMVLRKYGAPATRYEEDALIARVVEQLEQGRVVGWFQGRMEFGPRALGNRSILGDARHPRMQQKINRSIKFRESFRPFAPSVREEDASDYFDLRAPSPYMLQVHPVRSGRRLPAPEHSPDAPLLDRLRHARSDIPAVTHVDYSARVQTVNRDTNPLFWKLLTAFKEVTGYGLLINTSFNVRDEPIVCTPEDAYRCFTATKMDCLVLGNYLLEKSAG